MPRETTERFTNTESGDRDSSGAWLEEELRHSLKRVAAPSSFADSVMARCGEQRRLRWFGFPLQRMRGFSQPLAMVTAAMLVCAVLLGTGYQSRRRSQQAQAEQAAQQFALAMHVTQGALLHAEEHFAQRAAARPQRLKHG